MNHHQINQESDSIHPTFILANRYQIIDKIGEGGFGEVYKALDIQTNETVAIKIFNKLFYDCFDTKRVLREIYLLKHLNHKNIIKIRDLISTSNVLSFKEIYLVLDYMPYDLRKVLDSNKVLELDKILKIFFQIADACNYLKRMKIVHRDLKPSNILIDDQFNVKVCDLGMSRGLHLIKYQEKNILFPLVSNIHYSLPPKPLNSLRLSQQNYEKKQASFDNCNNFFSSQKILPINQIKEKPNVNFKLQKSLSHHVGTRWYRAPEIILLNSNYDYQIDIWALGCIFAELLAMRSIDSLKGPLFPGDSCYPLSPIRKVKFKQNDIMDPIDQLNLIFEILGKPLEGDLNFIENPLAKEYVNNFPQRKGVILSRLFPNVEPNLISFLKKMLEFNPEKRPHIKEIVENEIFKGIKIETEKEMEIESEEDANACKIDFETDKFYLDKKDLILLFLRELNNFHQVKNMDKADLHIEVLLETMKEN